MKPFNTFPFSCFPAEALLPNANHGSSFPATVSLVVDDANGSELVDDEAENGSAAALEEAKGSDEVVADANGSAVFVDEENGSDSLPFDSDLNGSPEFVVPNGSLEAKGSEVKGSVVGVFGIFSGRAKLSVSSLSVAANMSLLANGSLATD